MRLPKPVIEGAGLQDDVEIHVRGNTVVIGPRKRARAGWAEAAKQMREAGDDRLLDGPASTKFDDRGGGVLPEIEPAVTDSRDVAAALKSVVFPILRDAGFARFRARAAWRPGESAVEVVDFHSLGSYLGSAVGATSHSFGGSVGLYYKALHAVPWATEPVPEWPEEHACHARRFLRKSLFQLWHRRPDVWYVNSKGSNLDSVVSDVRKAVVEQALPWLDQYRDLARALDAFESREDREMRSGIALEMFGGGLNSLARAEAASALGLACGQPERARAAWQRVLDSPHYQRMPELRQEAERRLALI
ncbi:MAG TPA: DUF4304 domain-containing protein [Vicinamibacteria bacterium]|nr:DUF4304 domain-containing protein [Vicinamibacteria bacterium]